MNNAFAPIERDIDTDTDAGTIDTDTLEEIVENLDISLNPRASSILEQMEYYFVDAQDLRLHMSTHDQMQVVSKDKHIWIDLRCDADYLFDDHFFDISMRKYGDDVWLKLQKIKYHNR